MTSKLRFTHLAVLLQRKYDDMLDYYYVCLSFIGTLKVEVISLYWPCPIQQGGREVVDLKPWQTNLYQIE
jgi:hypothetical protein